MDINNNKFQKMLRLGTTAGFIAIAVSPTLLATYSGLIVQPIMKIGNPFQNGIKLTVLSTLEEFTTNNCGKKFHNYIEGIFTNVESKVEKIVVSMREKTPYKINKIK